MFRNGVAQKSVADLRSARSENVSHCIRYAPVCVRRRRYWLSMHVNFTFTQIPLEWRRQAVVHVEFMLTHASDLRKLYTFWRREEIDSEKCGVNSRSTGSLTHHFCICMHAIRYGEMTGVWWRIVTHAIRGKIGSVRVSFLDSSEMKGFATTINEIVSHLSSFKCKNTVFKFFAGFAQQ